jgi:hypothetical protein
MPANVSDKSSEVGGGSYGTGRELVRRFTAILSTSNLKSPSVATLAASSQFQSMATLLSELQAVVPLHILRRAKLPENVDANGILTSMQGAARRVTVERTDEDTDLAILGLDADSPLAGLVGRTLEVSSSLPEPGALWISAMSSDMRTLDYIEGVFGGVINIDSREYLNLRIGTPTARPLQGITGAPVIIDGKLAGIVALENPINKALYAIPSSRIDSRFGFVVQKSTPNAEKRTSPDADSIPTPAHARSNVGSELGNKPTPRLTAEDLQWLSKPAGNVFHRANELREHFNSKRIQIRHLLLALHENGSQLVGMMNGAKLDLVEFLDIPKREDVGDEKEDQLPDAPKFPRFSANVNEAFVIAIDRAKHDNQWLVEVAHLLYGVLSISADRRVAELNAKGITPSAVSLPPALSVEDAAESRRRHIASSAASGSENSNALVADPVIPKTLLAGYNSDDTAGNDLLSITEEVNTLAGVLAAKEVEPPLSLGLFGEWGTGKSFFMRMLEARIAGLSADAKKAESEGATSAYCRNVRQITFNAWNYIDADLWASLASEIFENLAAAITDERKSPDSPEQRALVLAAASSSQAVLEVAEQKKREADVALEKTEGKLVELQKCKVEIEDKLSPVALFKHLLGFAMEDEGVKKSIDEAKETLGIDEASAASAKLQTEILELDGIWKTLLFTLKNERRVWIWVLAPVAALGFAALAGELFRWLHAKELMQGIATVVGLMAGALAPYLAVSQKLMAAVSRARAKRNQAIDEMKKKRQRDLEAELKTVKESVKTAEDDVNAARVKVDKLNEQLEAMRADRRMADFVLARHQSTDYTQKLGTISRVRGDLKRLSVLLREVRAESLVESEKEIKTRQEEVDKKRGEKQLKPLFPRIDRIVLYIDDLDRCPEETVVKVLQAVHLLLAFPLFVVVVGVDPRWLLYSLKQSSGAFRNQEGVGGEVEVAEGEGHWHSTPMNYLEKIFQIPFTLRPIRKQGFQSMVDRYARSPVRWASSSRSSEARLGQEESSSKGGATADGSRSGAAANVPTAQIVGGSVGAAKVEAQGEATTVSENAAPPTAPVEQMSAAGPAVSGTPADLPPADANRTTATEGKTDSAPTSMGHEAPLADDAAGAKEQEIDRAPAYLSISDAECGFMRELHRFIPSPRAGKRFINIYRLLRASVKAEELAAFEGNESGGPYRSAMLLLAILTAYPNQAGEIALQLMGRTTSNENWSSFLMALDKLKREGWAAQDQVKEGKQSDARALDEREWDAILVKAAGLQKLVGDRPIEEFVVWAPRVARYSFQSGRVLHYEHE